MSILEDNPQLTEDNSQKIKRLSNHFAVLTGKKKELQAQLEEIELELKEVDQKLQDEMKVLNIENFKTPRGTFYINRRLWCSVKDSDPAFEYLENIGLGGLIQKKVNTVSLSSDIKKLVEEGKVILDELETHGISQRVDESVRVRGLKTT